MPTTDIIRGTAWEDCDVACLARITLNGANLTQAGVSSIARKVFDLSSSTPTTAIDSSAVTVNTSVFDTLQTDDRWTIDTTGYNFRDVVAGSILTSGNRYRIEYVFTGASSEKFAVVCEVTAREMYSA
jgi:hypothetical protein